MSKYMFLPCLVLSKPAWKLDLTSGFNTTDKIGFNHADDTIKIAESTLTCKCFVMSCLVLSKHAWKLDLTSGWNTTDKIGFNNAVYTTEISESTLTSKCLVLSCHVLSCLVEICMKIRSNKWFKYYWQDWI